MIIFGGLLSAIFIWSCILYLVARGVFENALIIDLLGFLAEYVIEELLEVIVAIGPGVTFLVGVLLATIVITRINFTNDKKKHFALYAVYFFTLVCTIFVFLNLWSLSQLASVVLAIVILIAFPILRFAVEEAGLDEERDQWFTFVCCFFSLVLTLYPDINSPIALALEKALAFCALAGASTFLIKKMIIRNEARRTRKVAKKAGKK